jgi:hypothetical protein
MRFRPRRLLQFSVSTLLLLTLCFALWLNYRLLPRMRMQQAVAHLRQAGVQMSFVPPYPNGFVDSPQRIEDYTAKLSGPSWLRRLIGEEFFTEEPYLIRFQWTNKPVTDDDLVHLKHLSELEHVEIAFVKIEKFSNGERHSGMRCDNVTDVGLGHISHLIHLKHLSVSDSGITDEGLARLTGLAELRMLGLASTNITDEGVKYIKQLRKLQVLYVNGTKVTKEGAKEIREAIPGITIYGGDYEP